MSSKTSAQKACALVTGASSGIGRAIAVRLARDGFHVLVHFNSDEKGAAETLDAVMAEKDGTGQLLRFDVKSSQEMEAALEPFTISTLVNNAGIHDDTLAALMSDDQFDRVMRTNAYGPFYLMRYLTRKMMRARSGCIVNISSLAGQTGNPGQLNYAASKAALIAMTKTLAMEMGARNIRVNAVAPGLIETKMIAEIPHLEDYKKRIPLGRFGSVDEVAGAVSFLCSKDAGYITGHTLSVNGGLFPS